jgi:hypothetical protein
MTEARPPRDGGDGRGPDYWTAIANRNRPVDRIRRSRRAAALLDAALAGIDGPARPVPQRPNCPRYCQAFDRLTLEHWADTLGSCPCPAARRAVA